MDGTKPHAAEASSVGARLRRERESRDTTLEEIVRTTEVDVLYLEALENGEYDALPGPAFGKLYIRAYADALGFDPQPLIEEYDRERNERLRKQAVEARRKRPQEPPRRRRVSGWRPEGVPAEDVASAEPTDVEPETPEVAAVTSEPEPAPEAPPLAASTPAPIAEEAPVEPQPTVDASATRHDRRLVSRPAVVALLAVALIAIVWVSTVVFRSDDTPAPAAPLIPAETATETPPPVAASEPSVSQPAASTPIVTEGALTVPEFGVGRRIVNRRVEGETDTFEEGTVAWFSTRVMGGSRGEHIRHVWLHEGSAVQSIRLDLGGPHWRTFSQKTLWGEGSWAVEARDADGNVLARSTFSCVRAGS
jgi:transcriptional regulator with XRE-family HTH domain